MQTEERGKTNYKKYQEKFQQQSLTFKKFQNTIIS